METIITAVVTATLTGLLTVILPKLMDRKWKKEDASDAAKSADATLRKRQEETDRKVDDLDKKMDKVLEAQGHIIDAQRVTMVDRVRHVGGTFIKRGSITVSEKENLKEMKAAYDALPGANGHLTTTMDEVEKLPVTAD